MALDICMLCGGNKRKIEFQLHFILGLTHHGIKCRRFNCNEIPPPCDLIIFWGHKYKKIIKQQQEHKKDYLVAELGYVGDRTKWTSLGFNGLNGRASFMNFGKNSTRWKKHFPSKLKKPRVDGKYFLIMGQMPADASVKNTDISKWAINTYLSLEAKGINVLYRPHPRIGKLPRRYRSIEYRIKIHTGDLADALKDARGVITYNSNSGVDAVLEGLPVTSCDQGSMVYNITSHDIYRPRTYNRLQWANEIVWAQWLPEEIISGEAWEHLRQRYI